MGSAPRNSKIDCFWSPTQIEFLVSEASFKNSSSWIGLLLRPISGEPNADGHEVDHAGYFTLDQIRNLSPLPPVNWEIAQRVLSADRRLLSPMPLANLNGAKFTLFVG